MEHSHIPRSNRRYHCGQRSCPRVCRRNQEESVLTMNSLIEKVIGRCGDPLCQLCCRKENFLNKSEDSSLASVEEQSAMLWDYLENILDLVELEHMRGNVVPLKLAIMGRDPYPEDAVGIPFAKPTVLQTAKSLSGSRIVQSLGIDVKTWRGCDIRSLFEKLLKQRIVFLNASYKFLGKGPLALGKHGPQLHCANTINSVIINSTENVVLCGEAGKGYRWSNGLGTKAILPPKFYCAPHPSARVYNRDEAEFQKYWAPKALVDMFGLQAEMSILNSNIKKWSKK